MVADQPGQPPGSHSPRARLRWLVIVVAVMAVLTAGWPTLDTLVADKQRLAAGASLRVGPGGPDSASIKVGPGWIERPAETDPRQDYMLRSGAIAISIGYVSLAGPVSPASTGHAAGVWPGLVRILRVSHPGVRLGQPATVTSGQGRAGLSATATSRRTAGAASVFVGPSGTFAIEMLVLAPLSSRPAAAAASLLLIHSLRFPVVAHAPVVKQSRTASR